MLKLRKTIEIDELYSLNCYFERTRYGFRHVVELLRNQCFAAKDKCCYYNRTWESYDYQSAIHKVLHKYFNEDVAKGYCDLVDAKEKGRISGEFGMIAAIAKMGDILCEKQEDKLDWKKRMLGTVPGIDFPKDWENLPEEEKQRRLDGAIEQLR